MLAVAPSAAMGEVAATEECDAPSSFVRFRQPTLGAAAVHDARHPHNWHALKEISDTTRDAASHLEFIRKQVIGKGVAVVIRGGALDLLDGDSPVNRWSIAHFKERCAPTKRSATTRQRTRTRKSQQPLHVIREVKVLEPNGSFLYYDANIKPMVEQGFAAASPGLRSRFYSLINASAGPFWRALETTQAADVAAVSGRMADEASADVKLALTASVYELCNGVLNDDLLHDARWGHFVHPRHSGRPSRNLWLSMPGVTTSWHYDTYDNFFVHLRGEKRVLVLPPSAFYALHFYPSLHPLYRKSQIVWEAFEDRSTEEMEARFEGWDSFPQVQAVTLRRGDVLYLPSHWNHRVEALGTSTTASLSFWSDSDDSLLHADILEVLVAQLLRVGQAGYGESRALDVLQAALHRVIEAALPSRTERRAFFGNLIHRQYLNGSARTAEFDPSVCQRCEPPLSFKAGARERAFVAEIVREAVAGVAAKLERAPVTLVPIVLSFVIEKALNKLFFADVRTVLCFIQSCFASRLG